MKITYWKAPGARRRQKVDIVREYSTNGNLVAVAIRLRNGEEWKVNPQELGPSRLGDIFIAKVYLRKAVLDSMSQFIGSGLTYKEARKRTVDRLELSAKSVGRYYKAWQKERP